MSENINFASIRIGLASPETILKWSHGEVTKAETINYRTLRPETDGLFCEKIFGPTKDWECLCGKYKKARFTKDGKEIVCDKCGVSVTSKKVRRARMGHIKLAAPVSHIWYFRAIPSRMSLLLDISPKQLEKVLYFANYIIIDPGNQEEFKKNQVLTDREYREAYEKYENDIKYGMGADAIKELLSQIDLDQLSVDLRKEIDNSSGQKKVKLIKRLEVVESFRASGNRPEWMILDVIPVIPPELRPLVQLDGGRFASSDLNELYRRVIYRNNRLKKYIELHTPEIIVKNEKRMLQEAVDSLIDNGRRSKPVTGGSSNRPLKSLSEMLRGKQGRFRQNLLGKRVDYSGRSVIVVGPELRIYQCGLPKEMALELFKPFVTKRLVETNVATNIKDAKKRIERSDPSVFDALEIVIKDHPVMLNRAPTLHRLSIEAFEPVLVEGRAIKLHPLVCKPFNADFDGDQMSVHVPLSNEAQAEARFLMLSANNFLKPADGKAVNMPSQDMVMGSYWLTIDKAGEKGEGGIFKDFNEAMTAYTVGELGLHAPIKVRVEKYVAKLKDSDKYVVLGETAKELQMALSEGIYDEDTVEKRTAIINATLGRYIFNQSVPQDLGFVNREIDEKNPTAAFELEIDEHKAPYGITKVPAKSSVLGEIIDRTIKKHDISVTADVLDNIKANGFKYSTKGAVSISIADVSVPEEKWEIINQTTEQVQEIQDNFEEGLLSDDERYSSIVAAWSKATDDVTQALMSYLGKYNPIKMMADSGARGGKDQIRQLAGMRGLMLSATGKTMEIPIRSNFREGMNILEYFIGARGSRKTLSDTALKTADSGYLTRRLVDVSQEVIVTEEDCGTKEGIWAHTLSAGSSVIEPLIERLPGRYTVDDVINPTTGEVIVPANTLMNSADADAIVKAGIENVHIRSILKCKARHGICAHCYGSDLASTHDNTIAIGEAVGIIAAQSIGEPGTQLTMRTFHSGGIAGSDITQGLPRVEELFEARPPKRAAIISETAGTFKSSDQKRYKELTVTSSDNTTKVYSVPLGTKVILNEGAHVEVGDVLTEGSQVLEDIVRIKGTTALYDYIICEVQRIYRLQGIKNNDKHIEVIVRQMTRKLTVTNSGSTNLLEGTVVDLFDFESENEKIKERIANGEENLKLAEGQIKLLGITKAALQTDSFLSAASFQETTRVLTDAAIKGKVDTLSGLKENVIIGKLIPAGTGLEDYREVSVEKMTNTESAQQSELDSIIEKEAQKKNEDLNALFGDDDFDNEDINEDENDAE